MKPIITTLLFVAILLASCSDNPVDPQASNAELAPNVIQLSTLPLELIGVNPLNGSFVFLHQGEVPDIQVGDIVVFDTGLFREVTQVTSDEAQVNLKTTRAEITDAVISVEVDKVEPIDFRPPGDDGNYLYGATLTDDSILITDLTLVDSVVENDGLHAYLSVVLDTVLIEIDHLDMHWGYVIEDRVLENLYSYRDGKISFECDLSVDAGAAITHTEEREVYSDTRHFWSYNPWPTEFCLTTTVAVGVDVEAGVDAGIHYEDLGSTFDFKLGARQSHDIWSPINDFRSSVMNTEPELEAEAHVTVRPYVKFSVESSVYCSAGIGVWFKPYLEGVGTLDAIEENICVDINSGLDMGASATMSLYGYGGHDYESGPLLHPSTNLWSHCWPIDLPGKEVKR